MSFSTVSIEGKKAAPDRIYYNGTVINNTLLTTQQSDDPTVVFQDQRQTALVPDSSSYEVSVQNFSLNGCTKSLPLFIPQISPTVVSPAVTLAVGDNGQVTYTYAPTAGKELAIGNVVNKVFTLDPFGEPLYYVWTFDDPQKVIAVTPTTFTIALDIGLYNSGAITGFASYYDTGDITTTIYTISFGLFGNGGTRIVTVPIIWKPDNLAPFTVIPTTANPIQIESDYYYCYTYTHWVSLVNTALNTAWSQATDGLAVGTKCPFIEYDETTGLFSINQDANTSMVPYGTPLPVPYNVASSVAGYATGEYSFVGMNTCLESLLSNFQSIYYAYGTPWYADTTKLLPEVLIDNGLPINLTDGTGTTNTPVGVSLRTQPKTSIFTLINPFLGTPITGAQFCRLPQDFISTGTIWSPISSFVLVTSQIPVRNEASSNPVTFGSKNVGGQTASGGAFQKVLLETPIDAVKADYWKGWVLYEPKTLIYSSLDPSHDGITDIDVRLFWRNRLTNSLIPVHIRNQGSMSFRLLFKKKLVL